MKRVEKKLKKETIAEVPDLTVALPSRVNEMVIKYAERYGVTSSKILTDLVCREFNDASYPNWSGLQRLVYDRYGDKGWECIHSVYRAFIDFRFTRNLSLNELPALASAYGCNEKLLNEIVRKYAQVNEDDTFTVPAMSNNVIHK